MILESIKIKGWRGYRDEHAFEFEQGFNLLVGRNEAGKSTLFEALHRLLFDRHNSSAQEIKAIRPIGSSLAPEATLVFSHVGTRYKVRKQLLSSPVAEAHVWRDHTWELDHEGDAADDFLRDLLGGDPFGRATRAEHRGLAHALWYLQREPDIPENGWSAAIRNGLSSLVPQMATSDSEGSVVVKVQEAYKKDWTRTGKLAKGSEVSQLANNIQRHVAELDQLRERASRLPELRRDLEELHTQLETKRRAVDEANATLEALADDLKAADEREREIDDAKEKLQDAKTDWEKVHRHLEDITSREDQIEKLWKQAKTLKNEKAEAEFEVEKLRKAAERHKARADNLKRQTKDVSTRVSQIKGLAQLRRMEKSREGLLVRVTSYREVTEQREGAKGELAELEAPDDETWKSFQDDLRNLSVVRAQINTTGIRVGFDLKDASIEVTAEPEPDVDEKSGEFLVAGPTRFTLGSLGHVDVQGGGESLEALREQEQDFIQRIKATLQRYDATSDAQLAQAVERRRELKTSIDKLTTRLKDLLWDGADPAERLVTFDDEAKAVAHAVGDRPSELKDLGRSDLEAKAIELSERLTTLEDELDRENKAAEEVQRQHLEAVGVAQDASNRLTEVDARRNSQEEEIAAILKSYGTREHLKEVLGNAETAVEVANKVLAEFEEGTVQVVEKPRRLEKQTRTQISQLTDHRHSTEKKIVRIQTQIEEAAGEKLHSRIANLEALLDVTRERHAVLERRAAAAKLLCDMLEAYRSEQAQALAGPLAQHVNRWLPLLTDEGYSGVRLQEDLTPAFVAVPKYGAELSIDSLSHGTREQLVVLLRLAMGAILSEEERQLVVIDDRLVNADPVRMKRLCLILDEVAREHCQVVVATCDDSPYAGIEGLVVSVPEAT